MRTDFKADFKLAVFEPFDKVSNRFVRRRAVQIVQPATIVSWHRRMFAWHWRWRSTLVCRLGSSRILSLQHNASMPTRAAQLE